MAINKEIHDKLLDNSVQSFIHTVSTDDGKNVWRYRFVKAAVGKAAYVYGADRLDSEAEYSTDAQYSVAAIVENGTI